jgi:hypothetical protein
VVDPPALRERPVQGANRRRWAVLSAAIGLCLVGGVLTVWRLIAVEVAFADCDVLYLHYDMSSWYSADPQPFGPRSSPAGWQGEGIVLGIDRERLTYRDWSGTTVPFSKVLPDRCG